MIDYHIRPAHPGDLPSAVKLDALGISATSAIAGAVFVAECTETGEIIGTIVVRDLGNDVTKIDQLYVHHEHRRRGIGSELLERAIRHAKKNGGHQVELTVDTNNPARKLYRKFGFGETMLTMRLALLPANHCARQARNDTPSR